MTFESYLSSTRSFHLTPTRANPQYADQQAAQLLRHLTTVARWIDGSKIDREAMAAAMNYFGDRYRYRGVVYRGTRKLAFDGRPASYTKKRAVAEAFGLDEVQRSWLGKAFFVVARPAPSKSLDLQKLLKAYADCRNPFCQEVEVILFNTPVPARLITEYEYT